MKNTLIFILRAYQIVISTLLKHIFGIPAICRYTPSCSAFAVQSIERYGIIMGSWLSFKRLFSCHPFASRTNH